MKKHLFYFLRYDQMSWKVTKGHIFFKNERFLKYGLFKI